MRLIYNDLIIPFLKLDSSKPQPMAKSPKGLYDKPLSDSIL